MGERSGEGSPDADADAAGPLLRARWPRALLAGALVVGHLASLALAFLLLIWEPLLAGVIGGVVVAALLVAWVILVGRWSLQWPGWVQVVAAALLAATYVAVAGLMFDGGLDDVASRSTFATPTSDASFSFGLSGGAVLALAALIVSLPLPCRRVHALIAAMAVTLVAAGAVGTAVAVSFSGDACQDFRFDRERWRTALAAPDLLAHTSDAERLGEAIVRCHTVDGASRATVHRLLGGHANNRHTKWQWGLGMTNDGIGPGDAQDLWVEFGVDDRARAIYLTYP